VNIFQGTSKQCAHLSSKDQRSKVVKRQNKLQKIAHISRECLLVACGLRAGRWLAQYSG